MVLPRDLAEVGVPPVKCQGIKTKLVRFIVGQTSWDGFGRWIEPFLGSGVVLFNLRPPRALAFDANPHIIALYQGIQSGNIEADGVRDFLEHEGDVLQRKGADHYYYVRDRFNNTFDPLDFLFLNRSCFNGMMRFNRTGCFNVPFCRKPDRFRKAYITKIVNQIAWVAAQMRDRDWSFRSADWRDALSLAQVEDFVYLDPPYIGRHADYYNQWTEQDADDLAIAVKNLTSSWAYSMWMNNRYRRNSHLDRHFASYDVATRQHFYHLGATESLRNSVQEALVLSPVVPTNQENAAVSAI